MAGISAFDQMVDDLLAGEEKVPCEFLHQVYHLGWLDDDSDDPTLANGTKIELPVYLASTLFKEGHLDVLSPLLFGTQLRNSLKADAEVVNLREKNEFFFVHGLRVAELTEDGILAEVLHNAFKVRYKRMLDTCLTGADGDPGGLTHRLSATENNLFRIGLASLKDYHRWKARQASHITACDVIKHPAKKPRAGLGHGQDRG